MCRAFMIWLVKGLLLLFSCSVVSDSLWPYGLQHTRLPCPSPSPGACSNSCPLSWWCYLTISSSVAPFSSCPPSTSGGQSIGASASALPMNFQSWFPLGLASLISLLPVQFSCSVMSDSLWLYGLQHARPPCPSASPGVYSNLCSLSPCCPRDSQESSPAPQFKSFSSLLFSLLYGPTFTSLHLFHISFTSLQWLL